MTLYALDGTGNRLRGGPTAWTHVALMATAMSRRSLRSAVVAESALVDSADNAGRTSIGSDTLVIDGTDVLYQRGVGSGSAIDRLLGGATGFGAKRRVRKIYEQICDAYGKEDPTVERLTIDIIGFSRGGATALHLANVVFMLGIRKPRARWPNSLLPYRATVGWIWFRDWPRLSVEEVADLRQRLRRANVDDAHQIVVVGQHVIPRIRFLGLFDAVSSFVLPMDTRIIDLQSYGFGFRLACPPNVTRCSHAMALDERRKSFRNVRVAPAKMMEGRVHRNTEVSTGAIATVSVIGILWFSTWLMSIDLGRLRDPLLIAFVVAVAATTAHGLRGGLSTVTDSPLQSHALRWFFAGAAALYVAIVVAVMFWIGVIEIDGVSNLDPLTAIGWVFLTSALVPLIVVGFASDPSIVRTRHETAALACKKMASACGLAMWVLLTLWVVGLTTPWWAHVKYDPWPFRTELVLVAAGLMFGTIASIRSSRLLGVPKALDSEIYSVGLFAITLGLILAWLVRFTSAALTDMSNVPLREYAVIWLAAMMILVSHALWLRGKPRDQPPTQKELSEVFQHHEPRELWFRGNHVDVGGGGAPHLGDHAIGWMASEANEAGLGIDLDYVQTELDRREVGVRPGGLSPTFDPMISRARRPVLDGDIAHESVTPSRAPIPETLGAMLVFNMRRLRLGHHLDYDPAPDASSLSRKFSRRLLSPHPPRFLAAASGDHDSMSSRGWAMRATARLVTESQQLTALDL